MLSTSGLTSCQCDNISGLDYHSHKPNQEGLLFIIVISTLSTCCLSVYFCRTSWHEGFQFSDQGLNLCPLQWKLRVLTPGPPRNSPTFCFNSHLVGVSPSTQHTVTFLPRSSVESVRQSEGID